MGETGGTGATGDATEPQTSDGGRPTGVTVLAALAFLQGLLVLFVGAAALLVGGALPGFGSLPGGILAAFGAFFIVIGLVYFLAGWGLLQGDNWAWIVSIVLAVLGLLVFPIGTIISIVILYYLTRPKVKRFFDRGEGQAA